MVSRRFVLFCIEGKNASPVHAGAFAVPMAQLYSLFRLTIFQLEPMGGAITMLLVSQYLIGTRRQGVLCVESMPAFFVAGFDGFDDGKDAAAKRCYDAASGTSTLPLKVAPEMLHDTQHGVVIVHVEYALHVASEKRQRRVPEKCLTVHGVCYATSDMPKRYPHNLRVLKQTP